MAKNYCCKRVCVRLRSKYQYWKICRQLITLCTDGQCKTREICGQKVFIFWNELNNLWDDRFELKLSQVCYFKLGQIKCGYWSSTITHSTQCFNHYTYVMEWGCKKHTFLNKNVLRNFRPEFIRNKNSCLFDSLVRK